MQTHLELAQPGVEWESEYRLLLSECGPEEAGHSGHILARANNDFAEYVKILENQEKGIGLRQGFVP